MSTRVTKHASPALLERGVRGVAGEPLEIVLHLPTAPAFTATGFAQNSAFPDTALLGSVRALVRAAARRPDARLVLFGHADANESEREAKELSDRRAQLVFALATQDVKRTQSCASMASWDLVPRRLHETRTWRVSGLHSTPSDS